jgi:hypothetical protein
LIFENFEILFKLLLNFEKKNDSSDLIWPALDVEHGPLNPTRVASSTRPTKSPRTDHNRILPNPICTNSRLTRRPILTRLDLFRPKLSWSDPFLKQYHRVLNCTITLSSWSICIFPCKVIIMLYCCKQYHLWFFFMKTSDLIYLI